MSETDYTALTHDWPVAAAEALAKLPRADAQTSMNFVYISGEGADTTGNSRMMFGRVKGLAEKHLVEVAKREAKLSVYNLRPAAIDGANSEIKTDKARGLLERVVAGPLNIVLRNWAPKWHTPAEKLAEVSVMLATGDGKPVTPGDGVEAEGWTLRNTAIRRLAGL